jgi:hypothetical protein
LTRGVLLFGAALTAVALREAADLLSRIILVPERP